MCTEHSVLSTADTWLCMCKHAQLLPASCTCFECQSKVRCLRANTYPLHACMYMHTEAHSYMNMCMYMCVCMYLNMYVSLVHAI
jgi:hypothetical protein